MILLDLASSLYNVAPAKPTVNEKKAKEQTTKNEVDFLFMMIRGFVLQFKLSNQMLCCKPYRWHIKRRIFVCLITNSYGVY